MTEQLEGSAARQRIDAQLSQRQLALDEGGYFVIYLEGDRIVAKHFSNAIDARGVAVDPETGKPIPPKAKVVREPVAVYAGRTAKELCVQIFEQSYCPVTLLSHAAYLGREAQRAEWALEHHVPYVQD
jgi:dihydropteroate synthase